MCVDLLTIEGTVMVNVCSVVYVREHLFLPCFVAEGNNILNLFPCTHDGGKSAFATFARLDQDLIVALCILSETVSSQGSELVTSQTRGATEINESLILCSREVSVPNSRATGSGNILPVPGWCGDEHLAGAAIELCQGTGGELHRVAGFTLIDRALQVFIYIGTAILQGFDLVFCLCIFYKVAALLEISIQRAKAVNLFACDAAGLVQMLTFASRHLIDQSFFYLMYETFLILMTQINHLFPEMVLFEFCHLRRTLKKNHTHI